MGNESSHLSGLEIDENATEVTDFWAHHQAKYNDSCRYFSLKGNDLVSVFKGGAVLGPLWTVSTPLEKCSNNLLKYRHPSIVRYISEWKQRSTLHLATEFVVPLYHILGTLSPLQICIGLNSILEALVFLHDQAGMSHNNVSVSAVYVTGDGQWKLGDLQYLCSFKELNSAYLKHARIHRYDKAIDPNEASYSITTKVDQYAFATLVEDVYKGRKDEDVPHLQDFRIFCRNLLQHQDPGIRPSLSEVLKHEFFNHKFITIYKFLAFLPLKAEEERKGFFTNILNNLKSFDEETIAKQLGGLFLSRLTMLNQTARKEVLPFIFEPRNERSQNVEQLGFFSLSVFKEHIKPRLMQLFGVRDTQIRILLLQHFSKYVHVFTHDELSQQILPELLLGIKDTDDNLVASTLICLSELVPILGASTVIGGNRTKFFVDGKPNGINSTLNQETVVHDNEPSKLLKEFQCSEEIDHINDSINFNKTLLLLERPSPVGGESIEDQVLNKPTDTHYVDPKLEECDGWGEWDNMNRQLVMMEDVHSIDVVGMTSDTNFNKQVSNIYPDTNTYEKKTETKTLIMQKAAIHAKQNILDISELDIKNQKFNQSKKNNEFDFFADMTPVIEKPVVGYINTPDIELKGKLDFVPNEETDDIGDWGENWND